MSSFQVCVKTFTPIGTVGVQTINGITDTDGASFVGAQFFFFGSASLNAIDSAAGAEFIDAYRVAYGTDNLSTRQSGISGSESKAFNAKIISGSISAKTGGSVICNHSAILFGGVTTLLGYVSASRSGSFDITYTVNDGSTNDFIVVILGGSDLTLDSNIGDGTGTNPVILTANVPEAIIFQDSSGLNSPATGAGGGQFEMGFANIQPNASLGQGAVSTHPINQGGNWRYQNAKCFSAVTDPGGIPALAQDRSILAITQTVPTSFQTDGTGPSGAQWTSIGGIKSSSGVLRVPGTTGNQTITTNIVTRFVLFLSIAKASASSIDTTLANATIGFIDKSGRQAAYLAAENTVGNGVNINGFRTLRDDSAILFGTPAAASTTISGKAAFSAMSDSAKTFTLNWTSVPGGTVDVLWLAFGTTASPPPANPQSGIYQLVPDKTNDTLFTGYSPITTEVVKIP